MSNLRKFGLIALAFAFVAAGLVRYGAIASSVPASPSAVTVEMPAAKSMNVYVSHGGQLGVSTSEEGEEEPVLGGLIHNIQESFDEGIAVDGTPVISGTGGVRIGGGTLTDKHLRTTLTVDPDSIAANSATTSAVTLTGATTNDHCLVSGLSGDLTGSTSTAVLNCVITASNTATVYYRNVSSTAAYNAGSAVLSIQAWSY